MPPSAPLHFPTSRNFLQLGLVAIAILMSVFRDSMLRIVLAWDFFGRGPVSDYELANCSVVKRGC